MVFSQIVSLLRSHKIPHATEREMQDAIESLLLSNSIPLKKEYVLSSTDRVDFFYAGIAIECKVRSTKLEIFRQIERYSEYPEVQNIILVTSKFMFLPEKINGKKTEVVRIGMSWL